MDDFVRRFLKHRGFSNDIIKAVEEKTKKRTEEEEMKDRLLAEAMTKEMVNQMLPMFRKKLKEDQEAKDKPKEPRKIIMPD
jgi:hypothetical protein